MTDLKDTLKQIITEARNKNGLLKAPILKEATVNIRPPQRKSRNLNEPHDTEADPRLSSTKVSSIPTANPSDVQSVPEPSDQDVLNKNARDPALRSGGKFGGRGGDTQVDTKPTFDKEADLRPGFNLYHGVVSEVFTQLHQPDGTPVGEVVKKVTQWALMRLKNGDSEGVFQGAPQVSPQEVAAIVQKSMQIIVHEIAQEATKAVDEKYGFEGADA